MLHGIYSVSLSREAQGIISLLALGFDLASPWRLNLEHGLKGISGGFGLAEHDEHS